MTITNVFHGKPGQFCLLLLTISFFILHDNYCLGQFSQLTNKNIYNSQLADPAKPAKGRYYPTRFSEVPAIKNNWNIQHSLDKELFFEDIYSEIFDYRIFGDSFAVVVARKIINRVVPVGELQDSIETAIYYYFRKEPEKNHSLSITRLHYEEFDLNGYIGVTDAAQPVPETYYISISGDKKLKSIDNIAFNNRTLFPSVSPGLFITQDETSDEYFCGLLRADVLSNPFENQLNETLFIFPGNITLAGNNNSLRFYRLSSTVNPVPSELYAEAKPLYADGRFTVVKKPGNIFSVFDRQDFTTKDITIPGADGTIEQAFVNPYSNNVIIKTKKGEDINYLVNDVTMSSPSKPVHLPPGDGHAETLSGNFLLYSDRTGVVTIVDMFTPRILALGSYPKMQIREIIQWSARPSAKVKNRHIGDDSIFLVIDHNMAGSIDRYSTAFCLVADAETITNPIELKCADTITGSTYEIQAPEKEYLPHYFLSHQRFLIFQPSNSTFYEVRNIRKSFGKPPLPANLSGNYVSIRPYIRYDGKWIAKAIEYKDGKEKIKIIQDP